MGTTESLPNNDQHPNTSGSHPPRSPTGPLSQRDTLSDPAKGGAVGPQKPNRPLTRISGVVVGGPKVGKRTLQQRLVGVDPYAPDSSNAQVPAVVNAPYHPPPGMPTWNRIQLKVGRVRSDAELPKVDFVVFIIRPTQETVIEEIQSQVLYVVRTYLKHLSYSTTSEAEKSKDEDEDPVPNAPVCICIMINFRDLIPVEAVSKVDELQKQVDSFLDGVLKQYSIPSDRLLVQLLSTSLRNCYGLDRMNIFIYRTYLQKKREALEAQLRAVSTQIRNTGEPDFVTYVEFCKLLDPNAQNSEPDHPPPPSRSKARISQARQHEAPIDHQRSGPRKREGSQEEENDDSRAKSSSVKQQDQQETPATGSASRGQAPKSKMGHRPVEAVGRRQLIPESKKPSLVGKDALEAFLASDDSDDERSFERKAKPNRRSKTVSKAVDSSSDDDDDDYFYDESGKFNNAMGNYNESSTSSSSDDRQSTTRRRRVPSKTQTGAIPTQNVSANAIGNSATRRSSAAGPVPERADLSEAADSNDGRRINSEMSATKSTDAMGKEDDAAMKRELSTTRAQKMRSSAKERKDRSEDEEMVAIPANADDNDSEDGGSFVTETRADTYKDYEMEKNVGAPVPGGSKSVDGGVLYRAGDLSHLEVDQSETTQMNEEGKFQQPASLPRASRTTSDDGYKTAKDLQPAQNNDSPSEAPHVGPRAADDDSDKGELFVSGGPQHEQRRMLSSAHDPDSYDDEFVLNRHNEQDTPASQAGQHDSDDDGFFVGEGGHKNNESLTETDIPDPAGQSMDRDYGSASKDDLDNKQVIDHRCSSARAEESRATISDASDGSDDEVFFVTGENKEAQFTHRETSKVPPTNVEARSIVSATSNPSGGPPAPSSGISSDALAAIQAAQTEAESMLHQPENGALGEGRQHKPKKPKKEKKSKKDGEKKAKRKKVKSKSKDSVGSSE